MRKKILEIYLKDEDKTFLENLKEYELVMAKEIVTRICDAIDSGMSYIDIVKIKTPHHDITLNAQEENYIKTLEINKETLIRYEEFELCARAVKCEEKLTEKNLVSK